VRVLGVDPGLARTGVAVVEGRPGALRLVHAGCVETAAGQDGAQRLAVLFAELEDTVRRHRPEAAAVEELFFATNRRSALLVSEARGVVLCVLARAGLAVAAYTPMQVKEAVAGYGAATKPQVGRMTRALLGVEKIDGPDDVTDACAVAICHHHRVRSPEQVGSGHRLTNARHDRMSPGLAAAVASAQAAAARRAVP
jgi:crossover junction endodeoxyribonuclease RuvC